MTKRKDLELDGRDRYFIDYDDQLSVEEDTYHIYYGDQDNIEFADYIAGFIDEEDAKEYVEWKNSELPLLEETEDELFEELEELDYGLDGKEFEFGNFDEDLT